MVFLLRSLLSLKIWEKGIEKSRVSPRRCLSPGAREPSLRHQGPAPQGPEAPAPL